MNAAHKALLTQMFDAAIRAADPKVVLKDHLPDRPKGRVVVVGAGKGAAQMAAAFEGLWDGPLEGVVVTRYGFAARCTAIKVLEAAHPVPDDAGLRASNALFDAVKDLNADDLVVALVCGGGSSLLPAPPDGLTLDDEQALNEALLASGAPIGAMNAIRKHCSLIKGGRLAQAARPARVVSLIVSDVPGDDPAQVASGPTVPDAVSLEDAHGFIESLRLELPSAVLTHLSDASARAPDPGDVSFADDDVRVVASAALSLEAAAQVGRAAGYSVSILSDAIEGEARDIGMMHGAIAKQVAMKDAPFKTPAIILSGGETTVTLRAKGRGGRNTEFLLSFANSIAGAKGITALAADTDGIDGSEDNAGAFADGQSTAAMRATGLDPLASLAKNDAWGAFDAVCDLFVTGPTGTNVNDFRAIIIE